ncbi:MAG: CmcJ/NvfI family oxidoreductase [Pseudomonadota bacterium]
MINFSQCECVESTLNYSFADGERPAFYLYEPVAGKPAPLPPMDRRTVEIFDVRNDMESLTLDKNGLCVVREALPDLDFFDLETVARDYYPQCIELVKRTTGAQQVVAFDHNVRDKGRTDEDGVSGPVRFAHNDYTDFSSPQRVCDLMDDEARSLLLRPYMFINVWRALRGPVTDQPLAICDAQTLQPDDFIPSDLKYRDRTGEIYCFRYNPNHRWMYISDMQTDEIILLKCFDSATDGRARYTAHSAFRNPHASEGSPPRRSIEVRCIAFF